VLEKHTIWKHLKESLTLFGAHFPDEPVKSSTMSDVFKDFAKWLAIEFSSDGILVEYTRVFTGAVDY
jgi:hypothetical protein